MKRWGPPFIFALFVHAGILWGLSTWELTPPTVSMRSGMTSIEMSFQTRKQTTPAPEKISKPIEKQNKPPEKSKLTEESTPKPPKQPKKIVPPEPIEHGETKRKKITKQPVVDEPTRTLPKPTSEKPGRRVIKKPKDLPHASPEQSAPETKTDPTETQANTTQDGEQDQSEKEQLSEKQKQSKSKSEKEASTTDSSEKQTLPESARSEDATWVEDPNYVSNPAPEYPHEAQIRGIEGRVILLVEIDESGLPAMVKIHQSSGSYILDEAAVQTVREWKFQSAVKNGKPVVARTLIPIRFSLDR